MLDHLPENTTAFDAAASQSSAKRRPNAPLWIGFLVSIFAFLSYIPIFAKYPSTRDMPWANFLIFALGLVFLFFGLRRAFLQPVLYRGKIAGPILTTLSVAALVFALADINGRTVSLATLLSAPDASHPTKGVLLVFYRGYW